ncbi:MAG: HD domain-containing protein, partial [Chitinophagales bacterium]|nr:HD domain-containing protein [Chitinophagales bacterium]
MKFDLTHDIFKTIAEVSNEMGIPVFVVGGFVRDRILGRSCKDIDFVCVGDSISFAKECARVIDPKINVSYFKNFGTAMFRYEDLEIEFVGARKESYSTNSRKPDVEQGTIEDDQLRRDFTINALAVEITGDTESEIIDPFNGLQDLEQQIIKTPTDPDITFSDDPLRMMRAIRFSSQLKFDIDPDVMKAIERNSSRIQIVSMERIIDELNKIILSPKPSVGFDMLFKSGVLKLIFPEMVQLYGVDVKNGIGHKDNFYHTLKVLDNVAEKSDDLWLRWAAILHDIAKPATKRFDDESGWTFHGHEFLGSKMVPSIFRRLKLPLNDKMKFVKKLVLLHLRPISLTSENITDSAVRRLLFEAGDDIDALMQLCEADITSKNKQKVQRYLKNFELVRERLKTVEE